MKNKLTPTLIICLSGALVAGIALARPGDQAQAGDGYGGPSTAVSSAGSASATVIEGFAFASPISVGAGAVLTVSNADPVGHTFTATNAGFDTGTINGGAKTTLTAPAEAGTYQFFCTIHPSMTGELIVG